MVKYNDEYIMPFRSHLHNRRSIIGIAKSQDGYNFKVCEKPFLTPQVSTNDEVFDKSTKSIIKSVNGGGSGKDVKY